MIQCFPSRGRKEEEVSATVFSVQFVSGYVLSPSVSLSPSAVIVQDSRVNLLKTPALSHTFISDWTEKKKMNGTETD